MKRKPKAKRRGVCDPALRTMDEREGGECVCVCVFEDGEGKRGGEERNRPSYL